MKRAVIAAAVAASFLALPAYAATDAECTDMWKRADVNADGVLSDAEAQRYAAAMRVSEKTVPADGRINQATFMEGCRSDAFAPRKADAGAPLKGANSFTEGQAKDRAMANGIANVSGMKKDDDGIWRGTGMQDGKQVQIAVDYKGNVVSASQ
ncbi:MAG: PepSY domain-containing protein [Enhydrobacter sp.]|nr:PepSY domain-containing protein [Enhydrobacter sp.]